MLNFVHSFNILYMRHIGYNIKKVREERNLTQDYVASELKISTLAYGNIERGKSLPNTKRLKEIADILDVKPEEFFAESDGINVLAPVNNIQNGDNNTFGVSEEVLQNTNKLLERLLTILEKMNK